MYSLAEHKGISDPETLKISKLLDNEILALQKNYRG